MQDKSTIEKIEYVIRAMEGHGYNAKEQLYGYIMLGNPTYITRKSHAREMLKSVNKDDLIEYYKKYL